MTLLVPGALMSAQQDSNPRNQGNALMIAGVSQVEHSLPDAESLLLYSAELLFKVTKLVSLDIGASSSATTTTRRASNQLRIYSKVVRNQDLRFLNRIRDDRAGCRYAIARRIRTRPRQCLRLVIVV